MIRWYRKRGEYFGQHFKKYDQTFTTLACWCGMWYLYSGHWREDQIAFLYRNWIKEQESSKSKCNFLMNMNWWDVLRSKIMCVVIRAKAGIWHFFGLGIKFKVTCFYFPLGQLLQFSSENWPQLACFKWKYMWIITIDSCARPANQESN